MAYENKLSSRNDVISTSEEIGELGVYKFIAQDNEVDFYTRTSGICVIYTADTETEPKRKRFTVKKISLYLGIVILFTLSIALIASGSMYLKDCPGAKEVPIFLIIIGCHAILTIPYITYLTYSNGDTPEGDCCFLLVILPFLVSITIFIITFPAIYGSYMVAKNWRKCNHEAIYYVAFITWLFILLLSLALVIVLISFVSVTLDCGCGIEKLWKRIKGNYF